MTETKELIKNISYEIPLIFSSQVPIFYRFIRKEQALKSMLLNLTFNNF